MDNTQTQLDPQAVNLTKAIRQSESGGNFQAKGASGEYGAYQYTEPTWNKLASKYGVNSSLKDSTPEQQNEIAYKQIKEWKDSGKNVGQIASMWNAGEGEPDAYTGKFSNGQSSAGTNKEGVKFNVPAYAQSVANAYKTLKGGGQAQADPNNPSGTGEPSYFQDIANIKSPTTTQPNAVQSTLGSNPDDSLYGQLLNNNVTGAIKGVGDFLTGGGAGELGNEIGTGVAGLLAGKNEKYVPLPDTGKALAGASKTVLGAVTTASPGILGELKNPLAAKEIGYNIPMEMSEFSKLGTTEKLNTLGEALKTAEAGDAVKIAKAIKYLNPGASFVKKLIQGGLTIASYKALTSAFGNTVGGLLHKATGL